jgi:hypothetical protein
MTRARYVAARRPVMLRGLGAGWALHRWLDAAEKQHHGQLTRQETRPAKPHAQGAGGSGGGGGGESFPRVDWVAVPQALRARRVNRRRRRGARGVAAGQLARRGPAGAQRLRQPGSERQRRRRCRQNITSGRRRCRRAEVSGGAGSIFVRAPFWLTVTCVTPVLVTQFESEGGNAWAGGC